MIRNTTTLPLTAPWETLSGALFFILFVKLLHNEPIARTSSK